jgi:hypothetical protein
VRLPGPGTFRIEATGPTGAPLAREAVVPPAARSLVADLMFPASRVAGVVVSWPGNEPIEGAEVLAEAAVGSEESAPLGATRSDAAGRFELENLPAGALALRVRAAGYPATRVEALELLRDGQRLEVEVAMRQGETFELRVVDGTEQSISGVHLLLRDASGDIATPARPAVSAEDGVLEVTGVVPGPYRATFLHGEYAPETLDLDLDPGAGASPVVRLQRGVELRVWVVEGDGSPVDGAVVEIRDRAGRDVLADWRTFQMGRDTPLPEGTDAQGRLVEPRVPAGEYHVRARRGERSSAPVPVAIASDEAAREVRVVLRD